MAPLYNFSELEILTFFLVLVRISAFIVTWPVFGTQFVPAIVKVLMALVIGLVLFPSVSSVGIPADLLTSNLLWLALKEAVTGALIGFLCRLFFFAMSVAGQVISLSMGLSSAQVMNPTLGSHGNVLEQFEVAIATLYFLAINGHHVLLRALFESFEIIPLSMRGFETAVFSNAGMIIQDIVVAGVKIGAPVMVAILAMNVTMGIIGRAVPQINVLITSLPVNILVGFIIMIVSVPLFIDSMGALTHDMFVHLFSIMKEI